MKSKIILVTLIVFLTTIFSCHKHSGIKRIVITDIKSNQFEINNSDSITRIIHLLENRSNTERVPLRNKGRVDVYLFDTAGKYIMWSFCNTLNYGPLLVREDIPGTIYKNKKLDSFFKEFSKQHPNFEYW